MKTSYKFSELTPDSTLNQMVITDQKAGELLASVGLDWSRHKGSTLRSICAQKQWNEQEVMQWIKKNISLLNRSKTCLADKANGQQELSKIWSCLENEYRSASRLLSDIHEEFSRVHKIHNNQYVWLKNARWHFAKLSEILMASLIFKQGYLIPHLERAEKRNETDQNLKRSIDIIKEDQSKVILCLEKIKQVTDGYAIPESACSTYRILISNLRSLDKHVQRLLEIERTTLIPNIQQKVANPFSA